MKSIKKRVYDIIEIGNRSDIPSACFDLFIVVVIIANLVVTLLFTFDEAASITSILNKIEFVTVIIFTIEYILRLWTADIGHPNVSRLKSVLAFVLSFYGLIDLLTFLPYYLPLVFPAGVVAFRMLRVIRIFRLFKINAQYDAFNVITNVLYEKRNQIISSMCLVMILMVASSLGMYSCEHDAQPDIFQNAFSGIWWSVSTLLTVGYGDIYPITVAGKLLAIVTSFLGVGMVAIPTGIISAGFVEQYTTLKHSSKEIEEIQFDCVHITIEEKSKWNGIRIGDMSLNEGLFLLMVIRGDDFLAPDKNTILKTGDICVIGSSLNLSIPVDIREYLVKPDSSWIGRTNKTLDLSRLDKIALIKRGSRLIDPDDNTQIKSGDRVIIYRER